ncbi:VWA domain-containing protein [Archangium violaceum]|uniref:vWA domain-containing protein n=1 Tax=Archangium violaceum TaxID=83451 RepID=UPI00193BEE2B|nr:VWA domain-containing protein [Archangium violaceum]QRK07621.1 VWA domain-containing protein [Archangium violaceum]
MTRRFLVTWLTALMLAGCGGSMGGGDPVGGPGGGAPPVGGAPPAGDVGGTPGGAQDMALARRKIAVGIVPAPEDFVVEGLYSEHDLPLDGAPCEQVLCLRTATGIATALDTGRQEVFVQVGFSSNVDPTTFRRKPLDVALVIDRSGSMHGEPLEAVKEAARRLVAKLDENDTFSLVVFDDGALTLVEQTPVNDREALLRVIDTIQDAGSTCIECGLKAGFNQLATRGTDATRARRLFLFTDAMPNVGMTGDGEFMELLRSNSSEGRDTTVFGVNIAFSQSLVTAISAVRGANSFYLSNPERTRTIFDEDFDYLVTPIAYDLKMALTPAEGFEVEAVYGLPGVEPGASQAEMVVSTVFLSRRRGAILARLSRVEDIAPAQSVMTGNLSFQATGGGESRTTLTASYEGSEPLASTEAWYSQRSVRKAVALTNFVLGARSACELWMKGEKTAARQLADRTAALLQAEADRMDDAPLRTEAELAFKLASLMVP